MLIEFYSIVIICLHGISSQQVSNKVIVVQKCCQMNEMFNRNQYCTEVNTNVTIESKLRNESSYSIVYAVERIRCPYQQILEKSDRYELLDNNRLNLTNTGDILPQSTFCFEHYPGFGGLTNTFAFHCVRSKQNIKCAIFSSMTIAAFVIFFVIKKKSACEFGPFMKELIGVILIKEVFLLFSLLNSENRLAEIKIMKTLKLDAPEVKYWLDETCVFINWFFNYALVFGLVYIVAEAVTRCAPPKARRHFCSLFDARKRTTKHNLLLMTGFVCALATVMVSIDYSVREYFNSRITHVFGIVLELLLIATILTSFLIEWQKTLTLGGRGGGGGGSIEMNRVTGRRSNESDTDSDETGSSNEQATNKTIVANITYLLMCVPLVGISLLSQCVQYKNEHFCVPEGLLFSFLFIAFARVK